MPDFIHLCRRSSRSTFEKHMFFSMYTHLFFHLCLSWAAFGHTGLTHSNSWNGMLQYGLHLFLACSAIFFLLSPIRVRGWQNFTKQNAHVKDGRLNPSPWRSKPNGTTGHPSTRWDDTLTNSFWEHFHNNEWWHVASEVSSWFTSKTFYAQFCRAHFGL